ncbi:MAG TPA: VWA domain-containing protein [Terriglobales bacterium]|nr:VWA domain-containing protein [Terriglobales bacterium]
MKTSDPQYQRTNSPDPDNRGQGRHQRHAGTVLYDAVFLSSDELMKKQPGRKAVIVLSDGVDIGSKTSLDSAIETAQRSDTLIYTILFADKEAYGNEAARSGGGGPWGRRGGWGGPFPGGGGYPGGGGGYPGGGSPRGGGRYPQESHADGKKVLQRMSQETGGRFFEVSKKETLDDIYKQISDELRNQYSIGYTSDRAPTDASDYHKIHLTTTRKDDSVQTRDGYYSD